MKWEDYKAGIVAALDAFVFDEGIVKIIRESIDKGQRIFVAGNGGSAALATHYVCDLSKGANPDWENNHSRYRAVCLSSNSSYMTCICNDSAYDQVFKQQLINLASPNDIVILISSSGNSPNVVEAAKYAKEAGLVSISVTGFSGGKLKELCDYSAHMENQSYEICEDIHSIFGHWLAVHLRETAEK